MECPYIMVVIVLPEPIRLRQDPWDASVSVADIDPGPVINFLGP